MSRLIIAGVGNVLRGDDGFGPAVIAALGPLPRGVEAVETGTGGVALLQELLAGCEGLVLVDAVDRRAAPGTLFELVPEVQDAVHVADVHLANPDRVLSMAKTMGALPARVRILGCQPLDVEPLHQGLSAVVAAVVPEAARIARRIVGEWLKEPVGAGR